jgi:hypothetical protein
MIYWLDVGREPGVESVLKPSIRFKGEIPLKGHQYCAKSVDIIPAADSNGELGVQQGSAIGSNIP